MFWIWLNIDFSMWIILIIFVFVLRYSDMDICKSDQTTQGKFWIQVQPNLEQLKLECHPQQPVNVLLSCEQQYGNFRLKATKSRNLLSDNWCLLADERHENTQLSPSTILHQSWGQQGSEARPDQPIRGSEGIRRTNERLGRGERSGRCCGMGG